MRWKILALLPLFTTMLAADDHELKLETERLIVFKNGYCLVVKRGRAPLSAEGEVYTEQVPESAVLGSFWAVDSQGKLRAMTASQHHEDVMETTRLVSRTHIDMLRSHLGEPVHLEMHDDSVIRGTVVQILEQPAELPSQLPDNRLAALRLEPRSAGLFAVKTPLGVEVLQASQIKTLRVHDQDFATERHTIWRRSAKRLTFQYADERRPAEADLLLVYFTSGVRWIPTYRARLLEGNLASLSLQGELLNELEDFVATPVDLVVGVPHFRFKDVISPLALETAMQQALYQAAPQLMGQMALGNNSFSNAMFTQRASEYLPVDQVVSSGTDLLPELSTQSSQDLFVYSLPALNLERSARAALPIFDVEVPYQSVYTWDFHFAQSSVESVGGARNGPLALSSNDIWHQVRLQNTGDVPWSTGPLLLMEGSLPLAQELLTYTSAGRSVLVPVTVAIDVRGGYMSEELERTPKALRHQNNDYTKISKRGTITLVNSKSESVKLLLTAQFGGSTDAVSDEGTVRHGDFSNSDWDNNRNHQAVNQHSTVRWELELAAGESRELTVEYHYYLR